MMRHLLVLGLCACLSAQTARVRNADHLEMPGEVDSNSPSYWKNGEFHLFNSTVSGPKRSDGADQFRMGAPEDVLIKPF